MQIDKIKEIAYSYAFGILKKFPHLDCGNITKPFKGKGLQFLEFRKYCFGDDAKYIDWKLYAKYNTPYVKQFEDDKEASIRLILDLSPSLWYGYNYQLKIEVILEICVLFTLISLKHKYQLFITCLLEKPKDFHVSHKDSIEKIFIELSKIAVLNKSGVVNRDIENINFAQKEQKSKLVLKYGRESKITFFIGDFQHYSDPKLIENLLNYKNNFGIKIISPMDREESEPLVSCFRKKSVHNESKYQDQHEKLILNKMIELDIRENYLKNLAHRLGY